MKIGLLYIWIGIWGMLLLASCTDDSDAVLPPSDKTKINFVLSMGRNAGTRALTEDENAGNEYDMAINTTDIHVFLYGLNNEMLEEVTPLVVTPGDGSYYNIEGRISKEYRAFKVIVYANCGSDPLRTTAYVLSDRFEPLKPIEFIPMWGVETVTDIDWTAHKIDIGTISLLRTMAKVEVVLDPLIQATVSLTGCSFVNCGKEVRFLPNGYKDIESTKSYFDDVMNTLRGNVGVTASVFGNPMPFKIEDEKTKSYAIYVPECSYLKEPSIRVSLREEPANGVTRTASIYFRDYEAHPEDNPTYNYMWDVTRDYHYRFIIKKVIFTSVSVSLDVEVQGYGIIDQYPDYE